MVTDRNRRTPSGNGALIPVNTEVVQGWHPGIGDDSERLDALASSGQSPRQSIVGVVRATGYRTMFRRSSGPLLGVRTSKPKRGRLSANKGTREARSRKGVHTASSICVGPGFTDEASEWRSRRSSPRLGKPATWRRAAGDVVLDRGRVRLNREGSR